MVQATVLIAPQPNLQGKLRHIISCACGRPFIRETVHSSSRKYQQNWLELIQNVTRMILGQNVRSSAANMRWWLSIGCGSQVDTSRSTISRL